MSELRAQAHQNTAQSCKASSDQRQTHQESLEVDHHVSTPKPAFKNSQPGPTLHRRSASHRSTALRRRGYSNSLQRSVDTPARLESGFVLSHRETVKKTSTHACVWRELDTTSGISNTNLANALAPPTISQVLPLHQCQNNWSHVKPPRKDRLSTETAFGTAMTFSPLSSSVPRENTPTSWPPAHHQRARNCPSNNPEGKTCSLALPTCLRQRGHLRHHFRRCTK